MTLQVRRATERGHVDHGWLKAYHTFSFGRYVDRAQMGFGVLRVINEDRIAAGNGFGTHPHSDMEIITYVLSGELEHTDSMGNGSVIKAGEFQRLSAGTGITHSEFNPSQKNETHLYQIWLLPESEGIEPGYEQKVFPRQESGELQLIASRGGARESLHINQDVKLYRAGLSAGDVIDLPLDSKRYGWIQVVSGTLQVDDIQLGTSDAVAISQQTVPAIRAQGNSEFLFFDLP